MSNYYAPCFYRIDFVVIPSYIELSWKKELIFTVKICSEIEWIIISLKENYNINKRYLPSGFNPLIQVSKWSGTL